MRHRRRPGNETWNDLGPSRKMLKERQWGTSQEQKKPAFITLGGRNARGSGKILTGNLWRNLLRGKMIRWFAQGPNDQTATVVANGVSVVVRGGEG